jgi:hypothetical protein
METVSVGQPHTISSRKLQPAISSSPKFCYGLPDVGQRRPNSKLVPARGRRPHTSTGTYSRVIGRHISRIAAVIRTDDQQIILSHRLLNLREPEIKLFKRACVTFDVVAMAVEHIEIDEIGEDETALRAAKGVKRLVHTALLFPRRVLSRAPMAKD